MTTITVRMPALSTKHSSNLGLMSSSILSADDIHISDKKLQRLPFDLEDIARPIVIYLSDFIPALAYLFERRSF